LVGEIKLNINKILGKKKKFKMPKIGMPKSTISLRGKPMNMPSLMGKKSKNDWDGDGIPNKIDCQPRNIMRQDVVRVNRQNFESKYGEVSDDEWFNIVNKVAPGKARSQQYNEYEGQYEGG